ncbi:MAG: TIR domain-containing protein [Agathobacter sp.]|nr:TIR domain-containing protein [Agathobacter sp.]
MEREYIAFISYRHLDLDRAVAERLHRLLENYKIPRRLRKSEKSLGIVFRDKDELPLSSDLTQDIYHALDHSQYLIVVCTPETPKSKWVRSEISYFLKNHNHNHIITVLAAGTPEESIPKEITTIYEEDGVTVAKYIEPLCAYLVAPTKHQVLQNLKGEFLRLVAAMVGCPYDALRQRQKRQRQKRRLLLTSVVSIIAISFIVMLAIKNQQIEDQLRQTQLNESRALALLSESDLASGDRASAIKMAASALPSEENERPYVAQAKTALTNALYVYDEIQYRYLCRLEETGHLWKLGISPDGKYALMDVSGEIKCYNIQSEECLWSFLPEEKYITESFHFLEEKNAVLCVNSTSIARLFSLDTGELLFTYDFESPSSFRTISPEEDQFVVTRFFEGKVYLYFCDLNNGDMIYTEIEDFDDSVLKFAGTYSADGTEYAAFFASKFDSNVYSNEEIRVEFFDVESGELKRSSTIKYCEGIIRVDSPEILAMEDNTYIIVFTHPYDRNFMRISENGEVLAKGYASVTTDTRAYWALNGTVKIVDDYVVLIYCNWIVYFDPETLDIVHESFMDETLYFQNLSSNGTIFYADENLLYEYKLNASGDPLLVEAVDYGDCTEFVFHEDETSVWAGISYAPMHIQFFQKLGGLNESKEALFDLSGNFPYLAASYCGSTIDASGKNILIRDADGRGNEIQFVYNVEDESRTDIEEAYFGVNAVFTSDGKAILEGTKIYTIDDGEYRGFEGASKLSKNASVTTVSSNEVLPEEPVLTVAYYKGKLHYWKDGENHKVVDLDSEEENVNLYPGANGLILIHFLDSNEAYVFDTASSNLIELQDVDIQNVAMGRSTPIIAIYNSNNKIELYDFSSSNKYEVINRYPGNHFKYGLFLEDDSKLICFIDANNVAVIDIDSGEILSQFNYYLQSSAYLSEFDYLGLQEDENGEYLYMWDRTGIYDGIMIDMSDWSIVHDLPKMLGYSQNADTLLLFDSTFTKLYTQEVYSLEELLLLAEEILE